MVKVAVFAPETVEPDACKPLAMGVVPIRHCIVGGGVPVIVAVNVVILPAQVIALSGLLTVGSVFTVILAREGEVSVAIRLSSEAFTVAVPPVPFEVNIAVAVPLACRLFCWAERLPSVWAHVTGSAIKTGRLLTGMASPAELERKLAVTVVVLPRPAGVLQIGLGEEVDFNCNHLVNVITAPAASAVASLVPGPVFTPHQLLSAIVVCVVAPPACPITFANGGIVVFAQVLPIKRLKRRVNVPLVFITAPAWPPGFSAWLFKKVFFSIK